MRKRLLILLGILWGSLSFVFAEHVSVDKALQVASGFIRQTDKNSLRASQSLILAYTAQPSLRSAAPDVYYYVFNKGDNGGYIIVSGDDRAYPILGYSSSGNFAYENIPENMKWWLQGYADQIQYAYSNGIEQQMAVKDRWNALETGAGLSSLKSQVLLSTALWEQNSPFNNQCPLVNGARAVTGCVATAMAIIMKYHQYPAQGTGSHSYTDKYGHTYSANFNTTYDWNQMLNDYTGNGTTIQKDAVAKLMFHCGVSCEMNYSPDGSGAGLGRIAAALPQYFNYDAGACGMTKDGHPEEEWASIIKTELDNQRPIAYGGQSGSSGHAFVFAGYNSNNQYYVNWGWGKKYDGSDYNGWFRLSALVLAGTNYAYQQDMVVGIRKPAGGSPVHRFVIAKYDTNSKGLYLVNKPLQKDNFTVNVSTVTIEGSGAFEATAAIAHINASGTVKNIVSGSYRLSASTPGGAFSELKYQNCKITKNIETGDQLCLVYKIGSGDYEIVEGTPDLPTRIDLTNGGTSTYKVTWNALTGVTVTPESGYDAGSISAGGTFKFKITVPSGKKVLVKNGSITLTPNSLGVYTLTNIQNNIQLTLSFESVYKVTWNTLTGVTVTPESGYNANSIAAGGTFKFKITAPSGKKVLVKNGSVTLTPNSSGVYTLTNIKNNIQLTLSFESVYKVTWNTLTGVTVTPESGYNAGSISAGGTFKFKITGPSDKKVVVKNGSVVLTPNTSGIYTLSNIQKDIQLTISLETLTDYKITIPSYIPDVIIELPVGFTGSVKSGDSFYFKADPSSSAYAVGVKVNGKYVYRDYNGSKAQFKVLSIDRDQKIEIEAINLSQVTTTKTVTTTAGNLHNYISDRECCYLQHLIVKGQINIMDQILISDDLQEISSLDFSGINLAGISQYSYCFMYKLKEIILPSSITSIGDCAFGYDPHLSRVVINRSVPPKLDKNAFTGIPVSQLTIVVPEGAGPVYRNADVWKNYTIIEMASASHKVTLPVVTGFDIRPASGYNASSVPDGSDFKFVVTPKSGYESYTVQVTANNVLLTPISSNVYSIKNVRADQTVKVMATPPVAGKTYQILIQADPGCALIPETGYHANAVAEGNDFKFHVYLDPDYGNCEVTVRVGDVVVTPDSKGVYTISNVRADKNVVITLKEIFTVTYVKPEQDIKLVAEKGYNAARVVAGDDFAFHLVSSYKESQLTVRSNGILLIPWLSVYTIPSIRENQTITVQVNDVGNEKISPDDVQIQVYENKICITHPNMKNVPVYVTSLGGTLLKADKLNGIYTEIEVPEKGVYIVSFKGFSRKVMVR